jgi:hypothetical protein
MEDEEKKRTLNLPSTLRIESPNAGVQLHGGLVIPAVEVPPTLALAIAHRLPPTSPPSDSLNRYDTPGCGDSNPNGPIMCCGCWNGEGPRIFENLAYMDEKMERREMSVS